MRQLGKLSDADQTQRLVDYLLTEGMLTRAEQDGDQWLVWIVQEDDFERAKAEFQQFQASPDDPRYQGREGHADELRAEKQAKIHQTRRNLNVVRSGSRERLSDRAKRIPITFGLTVICIVVAVWTQLGEQRSNVKRLTFASADHYRDDDWEPGNVSDAMVDIKNGQVWRMVTPAIVHFGILHLLFNMLWLNQLGSQIETRKGWLKYTVLLLALAVFANFVEVFVSDSPANFGGMSGVVYGLFGYIWIKTRYVPQDRFYIDPGTVRFMLIWFVICFIPGMHIANGAHAGGLVLGMAIGYLSSQMRAEF